MTTIAINRTLDRCTVLGPGERAVIWVQGCPLRCPDCLAPEALPFTGGAEMPVNELAEWLAGLTGIEGVTMSGGEPFAQAAGLSLLLDRVRAVRPDFSAMCYSGFTHAVLRRGSPDQRGLLSRLDLLVDGPYQRARHGDLRWRGSANQRVIALSDRYRHVAAWPDVSQGIEFTLGLDGTMSWAGVPPRPGFREQVEAGLASRGYAVHTEGGPAAKRAWAAREGR